MGYFLLNVVVLCACPKTPGMPLYSFPVTPFNVVGGSVKVPRH